MGLSINIDEDKQAALRRIRGEGMGEVQQYAFFIGTAVAHLAGPFGSQPCAVYSAPMLEAGRQLLVDTFPARNRLPKILLVLDLDAGVGVEFERLRRLVEPLDRLPGADPRMVLVGEARLGDFDSIRNLLWSHVVDWLPAGIQEAVALGRLERAWRRNSFRRQLLGMGMVSGNPIHVTTHQRTRLQMAKELRLDHLSDEPLFRAAMKATDSDASWDSFAEGIYWHLQAAIEGMPDQWSEAFDLGIRQLSDLKSSGLRGREDRLLLLRFLCALLTMRMQGVLDMTRKDLRELEEYVEGCVLDFLKGEDHG